MFFKRHNLVNKPELEAWFLPKVTVELSYMASLNLIFLIINFWKGYYCYLRHVNCTWRMFYLLR